jgi:hypothetical protein
MSERLIEMDYSLAGSLEKGKRFLYDVEKDAKEIDGWVKAGYAHYVEEEEKVEAFFDAETEPEVPSTPVASPKRTKAA